jgi:hypothetical protein
MSPYVSRFTFYAGDYCVLVVATFADLAGAAIPNFVDGRSLVPL